LSGEIGVGLLFDTWELRVAHKIRLNMDENASKEVIGSAEDSNTSPRGAEVVYVGVNKNNEGDDSKIAAGERRIFPSLSDFISKDQYKEVTCNIFLYSFLICSR
jgi:hypothetical protein